MIVLSCSNISLSFGTNKILENISFNLQESEKVGIVGVNGAGKSTLFKIIAGTLQPDDGEVFVAKSRKIGFLEQNSGLDSSNTIWDEVMSAYSHLIEMESRMKALEESISREKDELRLESLVKEYSDLADNFSRSGGFEYNSRVKGILKGLGFTEDQFDLKISSLSGGQKTRMALAKLLLEQPDILLLDEPTNHLDIDALEWLENFLKNYANSVLVISHDRYFLDSVTSKTIEIENHGCKVYNGNYTEYARQKALDREIQQKHYELQQKEIARLEAFIEQQRRWNRERNIIAAESRQKAIDRMQKVEKPKDLPGKIKMKLRAGIESGNDVLSVENLSKEYPGKPLFKDISFKLRKKENVFLLGPNGCGKSTLLKILVGKVEQSSGAYEFGHNVLLAYYDQELNDLDENNTVLEEVWDENDDLTHTEIRNALASFLFTGEDVFKPISVLSGGEKSRVALTKIMLSQANFLILDEPTNHLDINSREVLEDALQKFEGTILAVSHDRYFINKLSTRILEFRGTSLFDYPGNYTSFLEYKANNRISNTDNAREVKMSASKQEHIASKEERAYQRKLEKRLRETEQAISDAEKRLEEIKAEMLLEEVCTDHVKLMQLNDEKNLLEKKLEELYPIWEKLASEKEAVTSGS